LFDKSFEPYTTVDEINIFFGTNKSSTGTKSKFIRDLLNLGYFNIEFSTEHMSQNNPFNDLMMVNGFIVPKDTFQEILPKKDSLPKKTLKKEKKSKSDDSVLDLFSSE
jgi:hypothetical protein